MRYKYAHIKFEELKILLVVVESFHFLQPFQGWRFKAKLLKKHEGDWIFIGHKDDDDEYIFEGDAKMLFNKKELDSLDWIQDSVD